MAFSAGSALCFSVQVDGTDGFCFLDSAYVDRILGSTYVWSLIFEISADMEDGSVAVGWMCAV
jgi:hypothetical protein